MKKLITKIFIVSILCVIPQTYGNEPNWQKVDENNYIDSDSIFGTDNMYGFSFLLKSYNKGQYEPVNGKKILYTLGHYELNCAKQTYKIGLIDSYDRNGNFVNGDYNRYAAFQPLVQGSAAGIVSQKLCR